MDRLTKFVTPVGLVMTSLNSMKHYMPCVVCRHNAKLKYDSNGNGYTEKFGFCDTCEVKMLFNKLKAYEDAEEQGLLLRLPVPLDTICYRAIFNGIHAKERWRIEKHSFKAEDIKSIGTFIFLTREEAEAKLKELEE